MNASEINMTSKHNKTPQEKEYNVSPFVKDLVMLIYAAIQQKDTQLILQIDQQFRRFLAIPDENKNWLNWLVYNEFRILNAAILPADRPRVLIGGMSNDPYPTMHVPPLFRVADVVSLTSTDTKNRKDRVLFNPSSDDIHTILKRMPDGFIPEFFFDNQVESGHLIPRKISEAPFITVASVCHTFKVASIENVCRLFDVILPLSKAFTPMIQAMTQKPVIDLPFGLNWGAFHYLIDEYDVNIKKDIDVSLTFSGGINDVYGDLRYKVIQLFKMFSLKHNEKYNCIITTGLEKDEYIDILKRSKISINVVGIHGPYNYRTVEVMLCGALLFQLENTYYTIPSHLEHYLKDGIHYASFTFENFENKLLYFLQRPAYMKQTAFKGRQYLISECNYEKLYQTLFQSIAALNIKKPSNKKNTLNDLHLGMLYCYSNIQQYRSLIKLVVADIHHLNHDDTINNLLVVLCSLYLENRSDEEILQLLAENPTVLSWFQSGFWHGVTQLYQYKKNDILIRWHYLMFSILFEKDDVNEITAYTLMLEKIEHYHFQRESKILYHLFHPNYINEHEFQNICIGFFEIPLGEIYITGKINTHLSKHCISFMLWHCYRYLFEKSKDTVLYGEKLLKIFYKNSQLHLKLSQYYQLNDPEKSVFHYNEAVKFLPSLT